MNGKKRRYCDYSKRNILVVTWDIDIQ